MVNMRGIALLLGLVLVACGHDHDHESHDDHNHSPPFGGRLVELGDHEFQVELVHSAEEGTLDAHLFDGHVEVPVPTTQKLLQVKVAVGDMMVVVDLKPVANPYTKEEAGKASNFSGQHDKLKGLEEFEGALIELELAGKTFKNVAFVYHADGDHHDHDH